MRIEAQAPRVLNRAENDLTGQLYGRLDRIAAVAGKVPADETAQVAFVHRFRAKGVLHPETVDSGEIPATGALAVSDPAGAQPQNQPRVSPGRIVAQRPAGMTA